MISDLIVMIDINIIQTNKVIMNVTPSLKQRLFPFNFYTKMKTNHHIIYDEKIDLLLFDITIFTIFCLTLKIFPQISEDIFHLIVKRLFHLYLIVV
jgi:hypothetical protein